MTDILLLSAFSIFGVICSFYVSVIGFLLSALATCAVLLVLNRIGGGVYLASTLVGAFVIIQVGYFLGLLGSVLVSLARRSSTRDTKDMQAQSRIDHD